MIKLLSSVFFLMILPNFPLFAQDIEITNSYIRETIPGTQVSSAYMTITNASADDIKLLSITSNISKRIELHQHLMRDSMMQMQQVDSIIIKAKDKTVLQPHGYHVMIFELKSPLIANQHVAMTLHFSNGQTLDITLPVKGLKQLSHH
ncbi:copper chaperone PCu(A)C [Thalassotalea aquiviva]|uniref:copper chaperone PCu(A)C n=1 Tax=Thalassotalea aquiviva TaxID=3242415 RepID=UPI00352BAB29